MLILAAGALAARVAPLPASIEVDDGVWLPVGPLLYECALPDGGRCLSRVAPALQFYQRLMFPNGLPRATQAKDAITTLSVALQTLEYPEDVERNDESYEVDVAAGRIAVRARNVFGLCRALQTIS